VKAIETTVAGVAPPEMARESLQKKLHRFHDLRYHVDVSPNSKTALGTMTARLSWSHIKEMYEGEWVELVNVEWDWNKPTPSAGRVRHHASDRAELMKKIQGSAAEPEAVILYLGAPGSVIARDAHAAVL
jgi:hypothetical protein